MCAVLFSFLPFLVSGVPLQHQLLSDVESHIAAWQTALNPDVFANDKILQSGTKALPTGQILSSHLFVLIPKHFNIDLFSWSVLLSICTLLFFLCGLYLLVLYSLDDKLTAFLITLFSIIPIHALGGSTFGFQALGFLPRDLALSIIIYILLLYCHGVKNENSRSIKLTFFVFGLFANFYPSLFANIALTLVLAELIRAKKIHVACFWYGGLFLLGALPTVLDFSFKNYHSAPIDVKIMTSFYGYMMVARPFLSALRRYLRRFFLYAVFIPTIHYSVIRKSPDYEKRLLAPWNAIAISSFVLAVLGVYIESTTAFAKYLISRTSMWFMLSSMIICTFGLRIFFSRYLRKGANLFTVLAVSVIFLGQSNLPTVYRFLRDTYNNREQKREFHVAINELKKLTSYEDIILAPSEEFFDLAASVRTYSSRPIYVCYKYGGVSIMDGQIAREWQERYNDIDNVFESRNPKLLIDFMQQKNIHYAFVPNHYYSENDQLLKQHVVVNTGHYSIVKY
jgi:hypothetical protein